MHSLALIGPYIWSKLEAMEEVKSDNTEGSNKEKGRFAQRERRGRKMHKNCEPNGRNSGRKKMLFGLGVVAFGTWWLLRRMDIEILPEWVMTWPMLLIVFGVFSLIANSFRNVGGYIMLLIGSVFLARNLFDLPIAIEPFFWPAMVIIVGLIILFKPKSAHGHWKKKEWSTGNQVEDDEADTYAGDKLDTLVIFSGVNKEVISKNYQGGELTTLMGGANIHFGKADIATKATLELTAIMGGVKLIVPDNWDVIINTTTLMGGVEDKRKLSPTVGADHKTLILTGTVIMGGIEIKSY